MFRPEISRSTVVWMRGAAASPIHKPQMNVETKVPQRSKHKRTPAQCQAPGTLQQGTTQNNQNIREHLQAFKQLEV